MFISGDEEQIVKTGREMPRKSEGVSVRESSANIKDYLTPNVGNHSTDNYSLLFDGIEMPEAADTFERPESGHHSSRNYHVKFTKFNQELKLRKMLE